MEKLSKKFIAMILSTMTVLITAVAGFSGTAHADEVAVLNAIKVADMPYKTEYYVGDTLDTSGILITALFSDGTSVGVTSGCKYNPTVLTDSGTQTITVNYSGVITTFDVTVYDYGYTTVPAVTEAPSTTSFVDEYITTTRPVSTTVRPVYTTAVYETEVVTIGPGYTVSPYETTTRRTPVTTAAPVPATTIPVVHTTVPATKPNQNNEYSIAVNAKVYELVCGQGTAVTATVSPEIKGNLYVEWNSSDISVATVNQKGFVTACGEGDVIITATLVDENGRAVLDPYGDEISDSVVIKCTMTLWQKIVRFFRNLFSGLFF